MPNLNDTSIHYVKFIRGSVAAWELLQQTPSRINNDTLYFIYESAENSTEGQLYLGQKLISGVGSGSNVININDLHDIQIDNVSLADKQILVYNETSEQWENASLSTIINTAIGTMTGATAQAAGTAGLVPTPPQGAQNKYLKGDGTWAPIEVPQFNSDIFSINNNEVTLQGYNMASVGSIPIKTNNGIEWSQAPTGTLDREITTLEKLRAQLAGTDPDPISYTTIYMVPNSDSDSPDNKYDEYMIIGDKLELLGTFGQVNLTNYVTVPTFETAINSLENILQDTTDEQTGEINLGLISRINQIELVQAQIGDLDTLILSDGNSTLVEEVNTISDRLKWHELI